MALSTEQKDALKVLRKLKRFYAKEGVAPGVNRLRYRVNFGGVTTECFCVMGALTEMGLAEKRNETSAHPTTQAVREAVTAMAQVDKHYLVLGGDEWYQVMDVNDRKLDKKPLTKRRSIMQEWLDDAIDYVKDGM